MKAISNNRGSVLLWTVLLTVIITILLGAVMTATYAYFNYTMYTVRRQQAYFTARSAINTLIDEFSNQTQTQHVAADNTITYVDNDPAILPARNQELEFSLEDGDTVDFGFPEEMGTVTYVKFSRGDSEDVDITVTAEYADEEYTIKSTVSPQPLYFAGIAVRQLTLRGDLTLAENTDFYWNNTATLDMRALSGHTLTITGSLVTKGDVIIKGGTKVAHHRFDRDVTFSDDGDAIYMKKIWSPSEYIISNKTLVVDDNTEYVSSIVNSLTNSSDYTIKYCNNSRRSAANGNFGTPSDLTSDILTILSDSLGLGGIIQDVQNENLSLTLTGADALSIKYIKLLSLTKEALNALGEWKENTNPIMQAFAGWTYKAFGEFFQNNGFTVFDVSYIEFTVSDEMNRADNVTPLLYLFVDGGDTTGLTVRVKYGRKPEANTGIFGAVQDAQNAVTDFISKVFDSNSKTSYIIVYLEENGTIELGYPHGRTPDGNFHNDLVFPYSIYGDVGSTVVLHPGVTVLGEIYCDHLIVEGDAQVIYSNYTGSQIAKQKIAQYWTVINYTD